MFHVEEKTSGILGETEVSYIYNVEEKTCGMLGETECRVPCRRKDLKSACDRRSVVFHVGEKTLSQRVIDGVSCSM